MSNVFPLEIQELRRPEIVYTLHAHCFRTVFDVKSMLQGLLGFPADRLRLFAAPTAAQLRDRATLMEIGIEKEGHMLLVSYEFGSAKAENLVEPARGVVLDQRSKELIQQVQQGLKGNHTSPTKTDLLDCTGGVYFMKSGTGHMVAVFKPQDEEQGMSNNPKGYAGKGLHGLRPNFRPGEGYVREFAAYVFDHDHFCSVPSTTIAYCEHPIFNYPVRQREGKPTKVPKLGSLQAYVRASDTFEDISPSLVSIFELQKIALLDMRLLNCDRNASNMLAIRKPHSTTATSRRSSRSGSVNSWTDDSDREIDIHEFIEDTRHGHHSSSSSSSSSSDSYELIPIDHGYCLPTRLLIEEMDWAWFYSTQIEQPVDPRIKDYVNKLNLDELITKLTKQVAVPDESIYLLRVVHELIVLGINAGLTLKGIASMIVRVEEGVPSPLEKLLNLAEENAALTMENRDAHYPQQQQQQQQQQLLFQLQLLHQSQLPPPPSSPQQQQQQQQQRPQLQQPPQIQKIPGSNFAAFSPTRRGKSPTLANMICTPPRSDTLGSLRRVINSEVFEEQQSEIIIRPIPGPLQAPPVNSDNDYFVADCLSPTPPVSVPKPESKRDAGVSPVHRSPPLSFGGPMAGLEMKRMQTVDSASAMIHFQSLYGNHPPAVTAAVSAAVAAAAAAVAPLTFVTAASASTSTSATLPAPAAVERNLTGSMDTDSGCTASEASSYESGPSPHRRQIMHSKFFAASKDEAETTVPVSKMTKDHFKSRKDQHHRNNDSNNHQRRQKNKNNNNNKHNNDNNNQRNLRIEGALSPFEAFEVSTIQPMIFERQRSGDGYESGPDMRERSSTYDGTSISSTPSENMFEQVSLTHAQEMLLAPQPMARVASWAALESPALYNLDAEEMGKAPRQLHRMRREKRKLAHRSPEFTDLRRHFAHIALKKLITKTAKGMTTLDN